MYDDLLQSLPATVDREAILECLDRVLDPELDDSILKLGFVESVEMDESRLTVALRLPTYWCAPNFSYLMADDVRRSLLTIDPIHDVTVRLIDHFAAEEIAAGVNTGKSFVDTFPEEALENLGEMRALFLRKVFFKRQERLLRNLREVGMSFAEIARLKIGDMGVTNGSHDGGCEAKESELLERYLERRSDLGLNCEPASPLMTDLRDQPLATEEMEKHFIHARTVRVALDANGALCSTLLAARQGERRDESPEIKTP